MSFRPMPAVPQGALRGGVRSAASGGRWARLADAGGRAAAGVASRLFRSRADSGLSRHPAAVSPDGGRAAAFLAALAATLVLCSAAAADTPVWQDAGAQLPAAATLNAVAAGGGQVVAVGAEGDLAVAYAKAGDAWVRKPLPAAETTAAALDVALDASGNGWAVGWQAGADGVRHALIDRYQDGAWTAVDAPGAPVLNTVGASADVAYAGDDAGAIHNLGSAGLGPALTAVPPGAVSAVRGLALTDGTNAIAGGAPASGSPASSALVAVDGANARVTQSAAVPSQGPPQILAVAAAGAARLAVDGSEPCTVAASVASEPVPSAWSVDPASGAWQRDATFPATSSTRLCDAAFAPSGDAVVVGSFAGRRAVWRRGAAGWSRVDDLGDGELRGVAMTGDEGWAVGASGTLLHFAVPPPPPATVAPDQTPANNQQDTPVNTPAPQPDPQQQDPPASDQPAPAPPPADPVVDVTTEQRAPATSGSAAKRHAAAPTGRLLARLAVHRAGRNRLVVRFALRARARVVVSALWGRSTVGRCARALAAGRHRIVLTYRGSRPPTRLDIVVHRLGAGAHPQGGQQ